jgi:hypothetical protein
MPQGTPGEVLTPGTTETRYLAGALAIPPGTLTFRGRVFKQPEASQQFLSVCYLE